MAKALKIHNTQYLQFKQMEIDTVNPDSPFNGVPLRTTVSATVVGSLMIHPNTHKYAAKDQAWGVSSINGTHLDFMWFESEQRAFDALDYLIPYAENIFDSAGDPRWQDRGAVAAFKAALVCAQYLPDDYVPLSLPPAPPPGHVKTSRNYQRLSEMIAYVDKRIQAKEAQIADFKKRAILLVTADDPSWLDWKPTRLNMELCLYKWKEIRFELVYQHHNAIA